jgi:hypothetical protein
MRSREARRLAVSLLLLGVFAEPAYAVGAISYCPMTGMAGMSTGLGSVAEAEDEAVEDCIGNGGVPECCQRHIEVTDGDCVAVARGPDFTFGFGRGGSPEFAIGAAVRQCEQVTDQCITKAHTCR